MRLLKPEWVTHDGHPVFSLDIHPDCSRFATGGQGADTGRVVIWNMAPVTNESDESNDSIPKMLCQMDNHLACVNCVRWSSSGKFLASGSDDKIVMIWQIGKYGSSSVFGSGSTVVNVEQWRCTNTLRRHSGDVLDIAWSPNDAWLASCSVDNTIVIWNATKFPEVITVLNGHTGLVKGVTWDPVGKYIASQSDDKTLRVWRTLDWKQESIVKDPFDECGGTTHVLRLSWSPDGQFLVSAHAMNNSGPTARIIEREGWKTQKDFVGHRKAVTCVRFNPCILSKTNEKGKSHYFCCCAVGSRDRSLSIWLTSLRRPLVVVHDLFSNSVLDISWSKTGQQLLACSWDGTVAYIDFEDDEIGSPLSSEERNSFHLKMYGKSLAITSQSSAASMVIEDPTMLKLNNLPAKKVDTVDNAKPEILSEPLTPNEPVTPIKGPNKQIETRTADGKRRITPCFIAPAPDLGGAPVPFSAQPMFSSSKESKSSIVIEKIEEPSLSSQPSTPSKEPPANADVSKQIVVNGFSSKPQSLVNGSWSPKEKTCTEKEKAGVTSTPAPTSEAEKVKDKIIKTPVSTIPVKRKGDVIAQPSGEKRRGRPPLSASNNTVNSTQQNLKPKPDKAPVPSTPSIATTSIQSTFKLPVLKIEKSATVKVPLSSNHHISLELENNIPISSGFRVHRVQCFNYPNSSSKEDVCIKWQVLLTFGGSAIAASRHICCIASEDCTLSVFSISSGQRLLPPIILSSPISRLTCKDHYVMTVTSKGNLSVWNLKTLNCIVKNESIAAILPGSASIVNTGLTDTGIPSVSISTGKSYMYHINLATWILVSNSRDVLSLCSNHDKLIPDTVSIQSQPLSVIQQCQSTKSGKSANKIFSSDPELQQNMTLSHLDFQLCAAQSLCSSKEYKFWLLTLVRFLAQEGLEERIRVVCDDLLGPVCVTANSSWQATILGISKRDLLKEILPIVGSNLKLQRIFTEYYEQLESITS